MKLEPQAVEAIFNDCLGDEMSVCGIVSTFSYDPAKIDQHYDEIVDLLSQLPDSFKTSGGGGMSFLNACVDRDGNQWTGEHSVMEMLFLLGKATGHVSECLPRELWSVLPGGMPYYCVAGTGGQ
jgi:hypothetical protein